MHFFADWAEQCKQVTEVLEELFKLPDIQCSGAKFALCDAEELSEISLQYKVMDIILWVIYICIKVILHFCVVYL